MKTKNICYICIVVVLAASLLVGFAGETFDICWATSSWLGHWVSSPVALGLGLVFGLTFGSAFPTFNKLMSKKLLQYSIIGLGFGMNVTMALASGAEGMLFTIASVFGTLALGWFVGRRLFKVDSQTSYLISSGTAICGGSAIAAVSPIIKAKAESMSVALGVVFMLNGIALFVFPYIGDALGMSLRQFGMWAAIAIHDTSSVVGAGAAFDQMHSSEVAAQHVSALEIATTVKLTRALWIVPLALVTPFLFRNSLANESADSKPWYSCIPNFIIWFVVAIVFSTYILTNGQLIGSEAAGIGEKIGMSIGSLGKHMITLSLFFVGASLTRNTLRAVGMRPLLQGILLWVCISVISLAYILCVVP